MSLCKYDKVSLTTFNSGIASCWVQKSSISISLIVDVAGYFCLLPWDPLSTSLCLGKLNLWNTSKDPSTPDGIYPVAEYLKERYISLSSGRISEGLDIYSPGSISCKITTCGPQLKALSPDNLKIHSWVPGNFSSFHIHSGLGVVTASLPTLSKIVSLQIKSPWIIMPSVSRWELDCITAVLHLPRVCQFTDLPAMHKSVLSHTAIPMLNINFLFSYLMDSIKLIIFYFVLWLLV